MSEKTKRAKHREELLELQSMIEPARNDEIARRAIEIAWRYLEKAENQAKMLEIYVARQLAEGKTDCVEIVRCKDCKYRDTIPEFSNGLLEGCRWANEESPDDDDFCSYGERKEE